MRVPSVRSTAFSAALLGLLLGTPALQAQAPILTFTPGSGTAGNNGDQSVGWQFDVLTGVTLNGFSWYDDGANGLSVAHTVGIWGPSGILLASAVIPAGTTAPLDGIFRTVFVSDLFLAPGTGYILGGQNFSTSTDFLSGNVSGLVVNPDISFFDATFSPDDGTFERPTEFSVAETGFWGPSFTIGTTTANVVPEPGTMTLLATGGAGALYSRTTNPPGATGDGIAIAHRAGADVRHMEFVQFHPTAVATGGRAFLVSEAVRGEGAHLLSETGERFMLGEHPDAELAPRDVVTRVIQARLAAGRTSYLSLRHLDPALVERRFPTLVEGCARLGIDLRRDPVPVAPAAHYLMGGIATDIHGATSIAGLFAAGESACTGAHGANRLASNSLLECFVFAHRAVAAGLDAAPPVVADGPPPERPLARAPLAELRRRMWNGAGPLRDREGLERLGAWLDGRPESNPVRVATLIATAALERRESRGSHLRRDYPDPDPTLEGAAPCRATSSMT